MINIYLKNISDSIPIEPHINEDGWYAQCQKCWTEIQPTHDKCPNCNQKQDWSWFHRLRTGKE